MNSLVLTPYGTFVVFLALIGAAFLASWLFALVSQLLAGAKLWVRQALARWETNRALRKALRKAPRMTDAERLAMQAGSLEALAAFERALAVARH